MPETLKICCPVLGIDPESNSGGGVHDRELLKALAKAGAEIEILLPKDSPHFKNIKNWHINYTPIKHMFPPYLFNIFVLPYLFQKYWENKFAVIRVFNPYFAGPACYFFKLFHKEVPTIAMYHHLEESTIKKIIDRFLIKKWDKIVTVSEFTKKEIVENFHVPNEKIEVFYSGVVGKYHPTPKNAILVKKFNLKNKIVLLFLGGLKKRKNVRFLLDIIKNINDKEVILLICGDGPERIKLEAASKLMDLGEKVIFTGFVKEDEKNDYYNLGDLILFPTIKEGFGLLPLEAGLCAKPTIASNVASVSEVIKDNKTGFLVKVNDREEWLDKINLFIENPSLRKKMGDNARKHSLKSYEEKFNWKIIAQKYIKLYKEILERKNVS